ncbi:MAG: nuclear transport factor 2 family protein [Bacteroidota bacterium]
MKQLILLILLTVNIQCYAQQLGNSEEQAVMDVINQFFVSLEEQDTVLYKQIVFPEGQIWRINNKREPASHSVRYFKDDLKTFDPKKNLQEIPLSFDVKVHKGIAIAWVPYEFRVNGKFSHCGVDTFTLVKANANWKIVNLSYTIDAGNCQQLKNG